MNFRNCEYYENCMEQGHCPFTVTCKYDCYFVYKYTSNQYEDLLRDYDRLEQDYAVVTDLLYNVYGYEDER